MGQVSWWDVAERELRLMILKECGKDLSYASLSWACLPFEVQKTILEETKAIKEKYAHAGD